jgi:hypothetical protein
MRSLSACLQNAAFFGCLFALLVQPGSLEAAEPVTVHLQSGRSFTGYLDQQTTESEVVLRFEDGGVALWRPIDWHRVVGAEYQGKELTAAELRTLAPKIASDSAEEIPPPPSELDLGEALYDSVPQPAPSVIEQTSANFPVEPILQKVQSIDVRAELANWNAGVEMDGLILTVWPLDAQGQPVPVSGTLQVQLDGLRGASARSLYSYFRGNPFPVLGQWTQSMQPDAVLPNGAQFKLPFKAFHPEFDTQFAPFGLVQVRLAVPGHGTFATTVNLVRIRPFSPLRDVRQQLQMKRFFPQEQLTRTQ